MIENKMTGDMELTPQEAAEYLGVTVGTLNNDRHGARRIPFVKVLRKIRYRLSDLESLKVYHAASAN